LTCRLPTATREELQQPVFGALNTLQYPELHEESIGVLSFTRHLYRLMFASGITDFSLKARPAWLWRPCVATRPASPV
jgi:kinetochore protein Nuf2